MDSKIDGHIKKSQFKLSFVYLSGLSHTYIHEMHIILSQHFYIAPSKVLMESITISIYRCVRIINTFGIGITIRLRHLNVTNSHTNKMQIVSSAIELVGVYNVETVRFQ